MGDAETPSAASGVAVIMDMLWTQMKGIALTSTSAASLRTCVDRAGVSTRQEILNVNALKDMRVAS